MSEGPALTASVHTLKVTLRDVRPATWRRLVVPSAITLGQLHPVLQAAFDWNDDHLHAFESRGVRYEPESGDRFASLFRPPSRDEDRTTLAAVAPRSGDVVEYVYDFGDDWRHRLEVEHVGPALPGQQYPACTGGAGLAPQEDVGTPRPGRFGDEARARLDRRLRAIGAVAGRDLPVTGDPADVVFTGLFPELVSDSGVCPCGCGEILDDDDTTPPLPMLRPVDPHQLAGLAAASPLVRRSVDLATWLGAGRTLTPSRLLRPADAVLAESELGLTPRSQDHADDADGADGADDADRADDPDDADRADDPAGLDDPDDAPGQGSLFEDVAGDVGRGSARRIRSAKDLPQLHAIWSAGLAAGLIEVRGGRAFPGPGLAVWSDPADAPARIESWCRLLAGSLRAHDDAARTGRDHLTHLRRQVLQLGVPLLYTMAQEPIPLGALSLALAQLQDDEVSAGATLTLLPLLHAEVPQLVDGWLAAGALEEAAVDPQNATGLTDHLAALQAELTAHAPSAESSAAEAVHALLHGPAVRLTPLGRYGLARLLSAHGWRVPRAGDLRDTAPEDLLVDLRGLLPDDAVQEAATWIDARGEHWEAAVHRVVRSAGGKGDDGPLRRDVLPAVMIAAGPRVAGVLDAVDDDPWLNPVLVLARSLLGLGPEPTHRQVLWLTVDSLSAQLDAPDVFAADVLEGPLQDLLGEPGAIAVALALDHPATREVLQAAVAHLDDPDLARAVRKALTSRSGNPALRAGAGRSSRNDKRRGKGNRR